MSYQREREEFIVRMVKEGLPYKVIAQLLSAATSLQRYAELATSSEAADRDRIPCPASRTREPGPCLCDVYEGKHQTIPRITLYDWQVASRIKRQIPADWSLSFEGDPRGYVLKVIPPSYAERNQGRDVHNLDAIGVPARDSGLRF